MWFKRYGYKQASASGGGMGCLSIVGTFLVSTIVACGIAVFFRAGWLMLFVIPFSMTGFEFFDRYANKKGFRICKSYHRKHIKSAFKSIDTGATHDALESIRRAKIYGNIPERLVDFERINDDSRDA